MLRWRAVVFGCVAALGLRIVFDGAAAAIGLPQSPLIAYAAEAVALLLAGFVAGHFAHRWEVLNGALAASAFILAGATIAAARDATFASQGGIGSLPPLDFGRLVADDLVALCAASFGAWLAARSLTSEREPTRLG